MSSFSAHTTWRINMFLKHGGTRPPRKMRFKTLSMKWIGRVFAIVMLIGLLVYSLRLLPVERRKESDGKPKMVVITLVRSNNRSISLTINMIHSILHFSPRHVPFRHPFVIFHDENFTLPMQNRILSCIALAKQPVKISFVQIDFRTDVPPLPESRADKPIGYRLMCQFWSYDVFHHPAIVKGGYEYLMRMDDDSYFADRMPEDLLDYMIKNKIDYLYRSLYYEPIEPMLPVYRRYVSNKNAPSGCIYNNFFIMRLAWFHQSARLQAFLRDLIRDDLMLKEYIGDGCVHQAMLDVVENTRGHLLTSVFYGHNYHLHTIGSSAWGFYHLPTFPDALENTCENITVLKLDPLALNRIKIS